MKRISAWAAASLIMLGYWSAIFLGTGGWMGRLVILALAVGATLWGLFRLLTYRPDCVRGAGTLEEVRRNSHMAPADEPVSACPPDPEDDHGDSGEHAPLTE